MVNIEIFIYCVEFTEVMAINGTGIANILIGAGFVVYGGINLYNYYDEPNFKNYQIVSEAYDHLNKKLIDSNIEKMDYANKLLIGLDTTDAQICVIKDVKKKMVEYVRLEKYSDSQEMKDFVYNTIQDKMKSIKSEYEGEKPSLLGSCLLIGFGALTMLGSSNVISSSSRNRTE